MLKLPSPFSLKDKVLCFHHKQFENVVMQVPTNKECTESNTYKLSLKRKNDCDYIKNIGGNNLLEQVRLNQLTYYYNGAVRYKNQDIMRQKTFNISEMRKRFLRKRLWEVIKYKF